MLQTLNVRAILFLAFLLFLLPILVNAAPVGKITKLEGRVDVLKAGQSTVGNVSPGDNVDVGDIFRAKTNSRAEITFFNKNILRIHPATRIQISQYSDDGTRSNQVMKMDRGKVEAVSSQEFVKKVSSFAEGNKFEVHTPNAVAGIRGSGMTVGFAQMITGLFFSTGRGYFYNPNQPGIVQNVSAGFVSFVVGFGGMPSRPVPGNVSYVGGSGGPAPGTGPGTSVAGPNNIVVQTAMANPISETFTTTPPPTILTTIPNVFVGSVPYMTGGIGNSETGITVSINNVKFYGPSMTGQPTIWQADSVTGNYWNFHGGTRNGFAFIASGNGTSAFVNVNGGSDTGEYSGTWNATISNGSAPTGVGGYKQAFSFSGTASGTFGGVVAGTGSINGTASGVVPSTLTQDPVVTQTIQVGAISSIYWMGSPYSLTLSQIRFWGTGAGAAPYSWTARVGGIVPSSAAGSTYAMTSSSPVGSTATFRFDSCNGVQWTGTVLNGNVPAGKMGSPPYNQLQTAFDGKANGTYTSGSTLNGTASGKAYAPGTRF